MDQAQILIEVGGGTGSINFTVANVTATMNELETPRLTWAARC